MAIVAIDLNMVMIQWRLIMKGLYYLAIAVAMHKFLMEMLSDAISEHLFFKNFLGGHAPRPP